MTVRKKQKTQDHDLQDYASQADLQALAERVDQLTSAVEKLSSTSAPAAKAAPRPRSTTPKAATRGKTSPAPATDATPGQPPEL